MGKTKGHPLLFSPFWAVASGSSLYIVLIVGLCLFLFLVLASVFLVVLYFFSLFCLILFAISFYIENPFLWFEHQGLRF